MPVNPNDPRPKAALERLDKGLCPLCGAPAAAPVPDDRHGIYCLACRDGREEDS